MNDQEAWDELERRSELGAWVGDGWKPLILAAHNQIEALHPGYEVIQIKEKFGGLRYYCSTITPGVEQIIREAEKLAWNTCEDCGSTDGISSEGSWVKTLCGDCRVKE